MLRYYLQKYYAIAYKNLRNNKITRIASSQQRNGNSFYVLIRTVSSEPGKLEYQSLNLNSEKNRLLNPTKFKL